MSRPARWLDAIQAVKEKPRRQPGPVAGKLVTILEERSKIYISMEAEQSQYLNAVDLTIWQPKRPLAERSRSQEPRPETKPVIRFDFAQRTA